MIDLSIDRITEPSAEVLVWIQRSFTETSVYQEALHRVLENENVQIRYLTSPKEEIEEGSFTIPSPLVSD